MKHSSKHHINKLDIKEKRIGPFLLLNLSLYTLSAICFMIHTTGQSYTFAEGESDLGYDLASVDASVTVGTACTFTGTITSPHTASISNGISSDNIGTTILNTTCNDSGGYALYAIGYTNNEYGNTDLSSDISTTYNIPTGTATTGNTSNWSMKLNQVPGTTPAVIENNYNNYNIIPDDYTLVATLNTVTDTPSTSTPTGSSVSTTYQAYISPTQPAGTYTGKVKYTLVHPSTAPAPVFMQDTAKIKTLLTNYGDTMQAIDKRDGKKYWIAKLADGNIWMTQNLDHDIVAGKTYTSADTDLPEGTTWTPSVPTYTDDTWNNSDYTPQSYDPGNLYWNGNITTSGGTISSGTVADPSATYGGTHYHIGNYYNWTAAVAMNDSSAYTTNQQDVDQSICPAGWRLPTYSGNKSYQNLVDMQSLTSGIGGNIHLNPAYFIYAGLWDGNSGGIGDNSSFWSSVVFGIGDAYSFYFNSTGSLKQQHIYRGYGFPIRCVAV